MVFFTNEYNPKGDYANGTTGSMQDGALRNQAMSSATAKPGANVFADMLQHSMTRYPTVSQATPQFPGAGADPGFYRLQSGSGPSAVQGMDPTEAASVSYSAVESPGVSVQDPMSTSRRRAAASTSPMQDAYNQFVNSPTQYGWQRPNISYEEFAAQRGAKPSDADMADPAKAAEWYQMSSLTSDITPEAVRAYRDRQAAGSTSQEGIDQWWAQNRSRYLTRGQTGGTRVTMGSGQGYGGTTGVSNSPVSVAKRAAAAAGNAQQGGGQNGGQGGARGRGQGAQPNSFDSEMARMQELFNPGFQQAQTDLQRRMRQEAAVTGAINSGGYGVTSGRAMADLVNNQQAFLGGKAFEANQSALQRDIALKGIDAQRYATDMNYRAAVENAQAQANAANAANASAAAMQAAQIEAARYQTDMQFKQGMYGNDIDRERNIMNYLLGGQQLGADWAKILSGGSPENYLQGWSTVPGAVITGR